tara:strand:- start:638 stop:1693 length:1056 start_codon:yes stop_codon:yes gene_type:complete
MDFINDNNPKNINYVKSLLGELPAYVKQANYTERPRIARGSFANSVDRELPMHDAEHTFLSYAYLKAANAGGKLSTKETGFESKLKQASQMHGNTEDLDKVDSVISEDLDKKKTASAKKNFALIIDFEKEGGLKYYYPTNDRVNVEKSARDLCTDERKMPIEAFRTAANNIVKRARELNMPDSSLPQKILRTGADREFNEKIANFAAKQRAKKYGEDAGAIYYDIVKSASQDKQNLDNYINLFLDMDRINKVAYNKNMLNPYEAFYSGVENSEIEKAAEAHVLINEAPVPLDDFNKIASEVVEKNFNEKEAKILSPIVDAAKEDGGVSATLKVMAVDKDLQSRFLQALVEK